MKRTVIVALIAVAVLLAGAPVLEAQEAGPEALIGRARAVTLSPHFSREEITQALVGVLDAALLVLPATSYEAEFRGRIETVRKMFDEGGLLRGQDPPISRAGLQIGLRRTSLDRPGRSSPPPTAKPIS